MNPRAPLLHRLLTLAAAAALLSALFALLRHFLPGELAAPSERFHAMVPMLWLIDAAVWRREALRLGRRTIAASAGAALGLLVLFRQAALLQANIPGGGLDWREPFLKLWLVASLFVLYSLASQAVGVLLALLPAARRAAATQQHWWPARLRMWLAMALVVPYMFVVFSIHRFKVACATDPGRAYGLPFERVSFPSAVDALPISGWFIPCRGSKRVVVVCHGVGANKANFLVVAPFLHRAGFNVLMFDFRGHGDSPGHTVSFGEYEARDVEGAVRYLSRRGQSGNVALYAFSMGGSAVLHAMPHLPAVRCVVVDSTFGDFQTLIAAQVGFLPLGLDKVTVAASDFYSRLEIGASVSEISPRRFLTGISPRPLLIIHGTADALINFDQAQANFAAAKQPKQLWLVPGAGHCQAIQVVPELYQRRVAGFLQQSIR